MKSLQQFRNVNKESEVVKENIKATSDFKIGPSGRKVKAHRFKVGDENKLEDDDVAETRDIIDIKEASFGGEPPFILVLKRKAIRMYPDGTHVALYWNDNLKKYFSVPYENSKGVVGYIQATEQINTLDTLNSIIKEEKSKELFLESGDIKNVDVDLANNIINVFNSLNEDNKQKLIDMLSKSNEQFGKAIHFVSKYTK